MNKRTVRVSALTIVLMAQPLASAGAAVHADRPLSGLQARQIESIQFRAEGGHHGAPDWRRAPGPHAYPGWRGGPGWRGAPAWRGPPGWSGKPYWYGRPWVRRPYYGTIIAGVTLGTLITVAAVGYVPPRPAPNLCWYWADPYGNRGYWDYCS
jgi:hypothetical protein